MAQSAQAIYWSALIADFRRSGLTHVEFCRRRQISVHAIRHRLYNVIKPRPLAVQPEEL